MRKLVANIYIKLGTLALCVGTYIDVSYFHLIVCAFWVAGCSFYKASKVYNSVKMVTIIGYCVLFLLILTKIAQLFA